MESSDTVSVGGHEAAIYRDTVESIWVAIILAFVLRAFVVEAFVIPTGSMAPRLMGEHWDLQCQTCGYEFSHGYSTQNILPSDAARVRSERTSPSGAICPNCGARYPGQQRPEYVNSGDRVLVMKYLYNFTDPEPFDVVVFRNPQNNRENYIKRLIGVPGETLEIVHGDVFVSRDGGQTFDIRRKPQRAQDAMWQVVYDNDYLPDAAWVDAAGSTCPRWQAGKESAHWDCSGGRSFRFLGGQGPEELVLKAPPETFLPHYGYNAWSSDRDRYDLNWDVCTDLRLSAVLAAGESPSAVTLSLCSFEFRFEAQFSTDGNVVLRCTSPALKDGGWTKTARIAPMAPGKGHEICLTNVDFVVSAWVDGQQLAASDGWQEYPGESVYPWLKHRMDQGSNHPVPPPEPKFTAAGGPCGLSHVKVYRDVYYTTLPMRGIERIIPTRSNPGDPLERYAGEINLAHEDGNLAPGDKRYREVLAGGRGWGTTGEPVTLAKHDAAHRDLDEFFMLGDNSPQSLDSRGWVAASPSLRLYDSDGNFQYQLGTVPRYNMIGRAFFVYWPAGFRIPGLPGLPILPNVGRMRLIR